MNKWLRLAGALLAGLLFAGALFELYSARAGLFLWLGRFTAAFWLVCGALGAVAALFLIGALLALWRPTLYENIRLWLIKSRSTVRWLFGVIAAAAVVTPAWLLLYTPLGEILSGPFFRCLLWLVSSLTAAVCLTPSKSALITPVAAALGFGLSGFVHLLAEKLSMVTDYPFLLIWSEGNRFYDYSVYLGSNRYLYPGQLSIPYYAPGRYLLWGILFALPNTPIWVHRLWDAILWTAPYLILGILLARWSRLDRMGKWSVALWCALFLAQGPVYPTLVLSAILVVALVRPDKLLLSLIGAAAAGYYASLSRFTWLPAPASWAGFIWLSHFTLPKGEALSRTIRRLLPTAFVALTGLAAAALANPTLLQPAEYSSRDFAFSQPLLWYRWFPNSTYPAGILLGSALAAGPLIILLIWSAVRKNWVLNWVQILAYSLPTLIFLGVGLVASVKIGGGSNLHNLDMFLISLAILAGLAWKGKERLPVDLRPGWVQLVLVLAVALPSWNAARSGSPLELPDDPITQQALETIASKTARAQRRGDVLFIDHRQLLTFGYIKDIRLIPEYEKKYMMDQSMAGNSDYFAEFYRDLADQRFAMIVSQPLFIQEQDDASRFSEENNAWVKWVAEPLLCYYAPVETFPEVQVQLLVPRAQPEGCP